MNRQVVRRLGRPHLDAAIIRRDHHRSLSYEPLRRRDADAGVDRAITLVLLAHQLGPAGADDDRVARLELLVCFCERLLEIVRRDVIGGRKHIDALQSGNVDQDAAGHQAADVLDSELLESTSRADLAELEAIVKTIAPHLVGEGVELGADLAELGDDQLFIGLTSIRCRQCRFGVDVEDAAGIDKSFLGVRRKYCSELEHLAGLDQFCRAQNRLGLHHIGGTALVAGSPLRRAALIVRRHLPGLGVKRHATESKHRRSRHGQSAKVHLATSPMWIVS